MSRRACSTMILAALLPLVALAACGTDDPTESPTGDTGADTVAGDTPSDDTRDTALDTEPDMPVDLPPLTPFGLDARPSNATCLATDEPAPPLEADIALTRVWPEVSFTAPVYALQAPGDPSSWYVVERLGRIRRLDSASATTATTWADLGGQIDAGPGEAGLLGMAFHPDFDTNGQVYLSYTAGGPLRSRISRFQVEPDGDSLDLDSEQVLLELEQPFGNHNGGHITFGRDGRLYIGFGDGGSGGDPIGAGQDTSTLLGAILRIDVDQPGDGTRAYGIPGDNPFADGVGGQPEIFAWGLRNPWRFSVDRDTGEIWAGDVGQGAVEEIDRIELGRNYGWNEKEGTRCFEQATCEGPYEDPIVEHLQADGEKSITGGYVYRGQALAGLRGTYVYGDFVSGRIFGVFYDDGGQPEARLLSASGLAIASFAEGADGELYVVDYEGAIHRIEPSEPPPPNDTFPTRLSQTGCVDVSDPLVPPSGTIPYAPVSTLWSDAAGKARWLALPDAGTIEVAADGDFSLPVGSVLVKTFSRGGQQLETRLYMHHASGWAGYSYVWRDDGSDADLVAGGAVIDTDDGVGWYVPARSECKRCHTEAAGITLGLEVAQLRHGALYPSTGRYSPQLDTLEHIGVFGAPLPTVERTLVDPRDEAADATERATSYLHSNCSNCHRPEGPTPSSVDLRAEVSLGARQACDVEPASDDLGLSEARIVAPGAPERSTLAARMRALGTRRMPPLASAHVDVVGAEVIEQWIAGLSGCQ